MTEHEAPCASATDDDASDSDSGVVINQLPSSKRHMLDAAVACMSSTVDKQLDHPLPRQPQGRRDFRIAIICALSSEAEMVELVLDKDWSEVPGTRYGKAPGDTNAYTMGALSGHNVVLAYMPSMGGSDAAAVASRLKSSFTKIEFVFVVGICGVVPVHLQTQEDIVLGDCIISTAVVQYDLGRQYPRGFRRKGGFDGLGRSSPEVRSLITKWNTRRNRQNLNKKLRTYLEDLLNQYPDIKQPALDRDRLFQPSYVHAHDGSCNKCQTNTGICDRDCSSIKCKDECLISRKRRPINEPNIHFGCFGSANTVMRSGNHRDEIASADDLVAFDMESSGIWDAFPTIVIKSACDYADSHKNKEWQEFAAATAAAGLKAVLSTLELPDRELSARS